MDQETISRAQEVKQRISEAAAQQVNQGIGALQERLREFAEEQKRSGAERLRGFAQAAHRAASDLEQQSPLSAKYVHQAANGIEGASDGLQERSLDELLDTFERFARERPAALILGAMVAGLALTWLLSGRTRS